jgi:hypothetical protein
MRSNLKLSIEALLVLLLLAVLACTQVEAQGQNAPPPFQWKSEPEHPDAKGFEYTTREHHRRFALSTEVYDLHAFGNLNIEELQPREIYLTRTRIPLEDGSEFLEIQIDSTKGYPDWIEWPARIAMAPGYQEHYSDRGDLIIRYSDEMPLPADWQFDDEFEAYPHPGLPSFEIPSDRQLLEMGSIESQREGESLSWLDDLGVQWKVDPIQKTVTSVRETERGIETQVEAYQHFEDVGYLQTYGFRQIDLSLSAIPVRLVEEEIVLSHSLWQDGSVKSDPDFFAQALRLYPNPVKARLNVEWKYGMDIPIQTIVVRRINGSVLLNLDLGGAGSAQISAAGWPSGLLFVEIHTDRGVFHRLISKD